MIMNDAILIFALGSIRYISLIDWHAHINCLPPIFRTIPPLITLPRIVHIVYHFRYHSRIIEITNIIVFKLAIMSSCYTN